MAKIKSKLQKRPNYSKSFLIRSILTFSGNTTDRNRTACGGKKTLKSRHRSHETLSRKCVNVLRYETGSTGSICAQTFNKTISWNTVFNCHSPRAWLFSRQHFNSQLLNHKLHTIRTPNSIKIWVFAFNLSLKGKSAKAEEETQRSKRFLLRSLRFSPGERRPPSEASQHVNVNTTSNAALELHAFS